MKKEVAIKLKTKIIELEDQFSNPNREYNYNKDTYEHSQICPLSESVALVKFRKKSGKESFAIFFYIKNYWIYFFPTDSHELGMWNYLIGKYRVSIEGHNFPHNFNVEDLRAFL